MQVKLGLTAPAPALRHPPRGFNHGVELDLGDQGINPPDHHEVKKLIIAVEGDEVEDSQEEEVYIQWTSTACQWTRWPNY